MSHTFKKNDWFKHLSYLRPKEVMDRAFTWSELLCTISCVAGWLSVLTRRRYINLKRKCVKCDRSLSYRRYWRKQQKLTMFVIFLFIYKRKITCIESISRKDKKNSRLISVCITPHLCNKNKLYRAEKKNKFWKTHQYEFKRKIWTALDKDFITYL